MPENRSCSYYLLFRSIHDVLRAEKKLKEQGFLISAIRPPTVPAGTARLRITFTANHRDADVLRLAAALRALGFAGD